MIGALQRLKAAQDGALPAQMAAFGISGGSDGALRELFMSHPPLERRIAALRQTRATGGLTVPLQPNHPAVDQHHGLLLTMLGHLVPWYGLVVATTPPRSRSCLLPERAFGR
jgi:hypothetical protein